MDFLGNTELLAMQKTAFLASSTIAPDVVLRCYCISRGRIGYATFCWYFQVLGS